MDFRGVPPMKMSGNMAENWKFWRQRFETYLRATENCKKEEGTQCAQLLTLIGEKGMRIFNTFTILPAEADKIKSLLEKFEAYFNTRKNLTYSRYKLLTYRQDGESIEQYITELKNLALACELGMLQDSLVKDLLICGLKSETLREKLLQDDPDNLEDTVRICINLEKTKERNREITNKKENMDIQGIEKNYRSNFREKRSTGQKKENYQQCTKCGQSHGYGNCPAHGKPCKKCGVLNHFAIACRTQNAGNKYSSTNFKHNRYNNFRNGKKYNFVKPSNNYNKSRTVHGVENDEYVFVGSIERKENNKNKLVTKEKINIDNFLFIGQIGATETVKTVNNADVESWVVPIIVGQIVQIKLDTGAQANIILRCALEKVNYDFKKLEKTSVKLIVYRRFSASNRRM